MDFFYCRKQIHNDLDSLNFLPGLDLAVACQGVLIVEYGFGVTWHHKQTHLTLEKGEI